VLRLCKHAVQPHEHIFFVFAKSVAWIPDSYSRHDRNTVHCGGSYLYTCWLLRFAWHDHVAGCDEPGNLDILCADGGNNRCLRGSVHAYQRANNDYGLIPVR